MTTMTIHRGHSADDKVGYFWTDEMDDAAIYSTRGATTETKRRQSPEILTATITGSVITAEEAGVDLIDARIADLAAKCEELGADAIIGEDYHTQCWAHRSLTCIFVANPDSLTITGRVATADEYCMDSDGDISL